MRTRSLIVTRGARRRARAARPAAGAPASRRAPSRRRLHRRRPAPTGSRTRRAAAHHGHRRHCRHGDRLADRDRAGRDAPTTSVAPGDKLRIEVYKDPQLSQSLQVRPDGKITLPLVGDLRRRGLTPLELRDQIATALKEYVTNPVVTVIVVETVAPIVLRHGRGEQPGLDAAARADDGAAGPRDGRRLQGLREHEGHPHPPPRARGVETIPFNYKDAIKGERELVMLPPAIR